MTSLRRQVNKMIRWGEKQREYGHKDAQPTPDEVYAAALASGLSDFEAQEEAWPQNMIQALKV